jgi:hypothetical protein
MAVSIPQLVWERGCVIFSDVDKYVSNIKLIHFVCIAPYIYADGKFMQSYKGIFFCKVACTKYVSVLSLQRMRFMTLCRPSEIGGTMLQAEKSRFDSR